MITRSGWQLRIVHSTGYRYDAEVQASYNEARLSPQSTPRQVVLDSRLEVSPAARLFRYYDYWGSLVHAFDVHVPHMALVVSASSVVETSPAPDPLAGVAWSDLVSASDEWHELLQPSRFVPRDDEIEASGSEIRASYTNPSDAALASVEVLRVALTYEPGHTTVSTTAPEAWRRRRGVCQDFAHVLIGMLRAMGVPARYVSGYVHPSADAEIGTTVAGQSHAWVEAWMGSWMSLDPTAPDPTVGERHVVVARGRDYGDVPPLKGLFTGGGASDPAVTVELVRMA